MRVWQKMTNKNKALTKENIATTSNIPVDISTCKLAFEREPDKLNGILYPHTTLSFRKKLASINGSMQCVTSSSRLYFNELSNIPKLEQELQIGVNDDQAVITCSYTKYITKLKKNSLFEVSRILLSKSSLRILELQGRLPARAVSLSKKLRRTTVFSDDLQKTNKEVSLYE